MSEFQTENMGQENSGSQALKILLHRAKDGSLREVLQDWKWIWSFSRGRAGAIALYTLCGIFSSCLGLAAGVISKYMIDAIVGLNLDGLKVLIPLMIASGIAAVGFRSFTARLSAKLGVAMHNDVQHAVFESLLSSRWQEIRRFSTGDLLSRFTGDIGTISGCAVSWLPNVIIQAFTLLATLAVVLYYDPIMALIAFASTPILFLTSRHLLRRQRSFNQQMRQVSSHMSAFQAETFRNIDTLKSFGVEDVSVEKLGHWQQTYRDTTLKYSIFSIKTNLLLTALGTVVQYLALGYCLWRLWRGEILFGTMTLFLQQRSRLSNAFSSLIGQIPTALSGSVAAERVRELMQLEKEPVADKVMPVGSCAVTVENVSVSYQDGREVLSGASLFAGAGETVALIGPSGEGKSTLMRLLLGLITPQCGTLSLTDGAGTTYPLGPETRSCFAYVPQGNTLIAGTVAENLRLVKADAGEEEMIRALRDACAWEFVEKMPGGLHAPIGEGGKGLSEGQAQRIAIARALLRQAPVMLLDEVTSALDFETEQRVLQALMNRGVTCIVATHRPSVLNLCDRIYRVQQGCVEALSVQQAALLTGMEKEKG